ncbi:hypothetical protein QFC22_005186 [Naganishia vaughanmartiniae]|uniref:Uncharacterized protein n=1 Tax=Naganishia vaughanmartiniae TaxID=1424756 RepID=A0ACC2WWA3_9TREE|nr:hypothetical protein QFC22_005186 [Naganishia vaughanmartiniae]
MPLSLLVATLCLTGLAQAANNHLDGRNLAYRSPYLNHDSLAVDVHAIAKRHEDSATILRKRQLQEAAPTGTPDNYITAGYGLGVVDWTDASYIFAGNLNFTHAVASGDPYDYSVLLWTRALPVEQAAVDVPVCVTYNVFDGLSGTGNVVASGYAFTSYDVDFTVKVEATGLKASTYYSYQFANCAKPDQKSAIGRTKTAPAKHGTNLDTQKFAVYSCSNWPNGFFNAYGGPVEHQDVDYVLHLGDYIYEYGTGGAAINRTNWDGKELASLQDYRLRYNQYRTDPDLVASHLNFPWILIWDDHETANNDWKGGSQDSNNTYPAGCSYGNQTGICFSERAANAKRAYHEWIPIRQVNVSDEQRIWRDFRFGDLIDLVALDTRKYDRDITDLTPNIPNLASVSDLAVQLNSSRSMTGPVQEKWMLDTLDDSVKRHTTWRMILNQVIFGTINHTSTAPIPTPSSFSINYDAWDGYQAQRQRILQHAHDNEWNNTFIVTGDTHASWLLENTLETVLEGTKLANTTLRANPVDTNYKRGQLVEFGGTAVSSGGWGATWLNEKNATSRAATGLVADSGSLFWSEGFYRGYMALEVSYSNVTTTFYGFPDNQIKRTNNRTMLAKFTVPSGQNQVQRPFKVQAGAVKPGN